MYFNEIGRMKINLSSHSKHYKDSNPRILYLDAVFKGILKL